MNDWESREKVIDQVHTYRAQIDDARMVASVHNSHSAQIEADRLEQAVDYLIETHGLEGPELIQESTGSNDELPFYEVN